MAKNNFWFSAAEKRRRRRLQGLLPLEVDGYNGRPDARYVFDYVDPKSGISHYRLSKEELRFERTGRRDK